MMSTAYGVRTSSANCEAQIEPFLGLEASLELILASGNLFRYEKDRPNMMVQRQ